MIGWGKRDQYPFDTHAVDQVLERFPVPAEDHPDALQVRIRFVKAGWGWLTERVRWVYAADLDAALLMVAGTIGGRVAYSRNRPVVQVPEKLWTQPEVLTRLGEAGHGIKAGTWESYVARGQAPAPVEKRPNRWSQADVEAWLGKRPGQGARTDLAEA